VPAAPLPCPSETESWDDVQREASGTVEVVELAVLVVDVEVGLGRVVVEVEFGGALLEAGVDVQLAKTHPPRVIETSTPKSLSRRCSVERETVLSSVECRVVECRVFDRRVSDSSHCPAGLPARLWKRCTLATPKCPGERSLIVPVRDWDWGKHRATRNHPV
jgi:hypothetical protein